MSRNAAALILYFLVLLPIPAHPAAAQETMDARMEELIARQKEMFGIPEAPPGSDADLIARGLKRAR